MRNTQTPSQAGGPFLRMMENAPMGNPSPKEGSWRSSPIPGFAILMLVLLMAFLPSIALAQKDGDGEGKGRIPVPEYTDYVVDEANMMSVEVGNRLSKRIHELFSETGWQIAVLTVPSTGEDSSFDYSMRVAEDWRVGRWDKPDGVLILVVRDTRRIQLLVGHGLEKKISDNVARAIIARAMVPHFMRGDYATGIENAVSALDNVMRGEKLPDYISGEDKKEESPIEKHKFFFIFFVFLGIGAMSFFKKAFGRGLMAALVSVSIGGCVTGLLGLLVGIPFSQSFWIVFIAGLLILAKVDGGFSSSSGNRSGGGGFGGGSGGSFGGGGSGGGW